MSRVGLFFGPGLGPISCIKFGSTASGLVPDICVLWPPPACLGILAVFRTGFDADLADADPGSGANRCFVFSSIVVFFSGSNAPPFADF